MRIRLLSLSLMLLAAACGGTDAAPATTGSPPATTGTTGSATTAEPGATAAPTTEALRAEGPIAPSFVTTLSDGSQFDMAAHDRPVYLVFWAEW